MLLPFLRITPTSLGPVAHLLGVQVVAGSKPGPPVDLSAVLKTGPVINLAQLGARLNGIQEVTGSAGTQVQILSPRWSARARVS